MLGEPPSGLLPRSNADGFCVLRVYPGRSAFQRVEMVANRFSRALIPIALLIFGTPFIALMFYASPHEDDFARATE
jgi:hypothetical protein